MMTFILIIAVVAASFFMGRIIFRSYFNPITVYSLIWGIELVLYEWRLMRYYDLSTQTWLVIAAAYLCFLMGVWTIAAVRQFNNGEQIKTDAPQVRVTGTFCHGRILNILIYTTAVAGLIGAIQHWMVLFGMFGSWVNILLNAPTIYMMRVQGQIHGVVPYLVTFSFVAAFLSGIYTGKKGKWHPGTVLAFLGVVLEDTANVARAGMLLVFLEFFTVVVLCRMGLQKNEKNRAANKKLIWSFLTLFVILASFATAIKSARTVVEDYKSASRALNKLNKNGIITPTVYMYFSCQTGVLNKYLERDDEKAMWGENTFLPLYNFISRTGIIKHPSFYQRGYFVPMWSNTGTYLREIHADFGYAGLFLVPYLLGFGTVFYWFRYFERRRLTDLLLLVYLMLILYFSFLVMITRLGHWWISLVILLPIIRIFENPSNKRRSFFAPDAS